jgi:CarD family transcriptional regulator
MAYGVGDTVIYPNHGAAVVKEIETRRFKGADITYLVLRIVAQNGLEMRVPACNLELIGVREVVDGEGLQRVLDTLRARPVEDPSSWSRRYRDNTGKLRTGCAIGVAEVVRDLWRRDRAGHLSAAEGQLLSRARQILVSELAQCHQANHDKAETFLDEALAC